MGKWEMVRLNEAANFNMGQSPSSESYNDEGQGVPFFQGKTDFGLIYPTVRMYCTDPKKIAEKHDVLISVRAPVGAVNIAVETCCIGRGLAAISQKRGTSDYRYLYYFLKYKENDIANMGVGSTFKAISKKDLDAIEIPLPPLPVQKKIANVLDRTSALIEKRKAQIDKLDLLVKSQFIEMFGDVFLNTKGWQQVNIRATSELFSDGPFGSNLKSEHYTAIGIQVVRLQNIGIGHFNNDDKAFVPVGHYETIKKHTCLPGDVLIGTLGDPNLRACILPVNIPCAINKADCIQWRVNKKILSNVYAMELLNSKAMLAKVQYLMHGQTRVRISMGQLATVEIPIPPLALQNHFADFAGQVEAQKSLLQQSLAKLEINYKSLMQKCFKGGIY